MPAKSLTVRGVPEKVHRVLAARAAQRGQSLQEFVRAELTRLAARPDPEELVERIRVRKDALGTRLSAGQILEHRDAERS